MKWRIIGVIAGLIAGGLTVGLVEGISSLIFPAPEGLDFNDPETFREFVASLPTGAFVLVLVAHAMGAFVAGAVCALVSGERPFRGALFLGVFFTCAGIVNLLLIPHPIWFALIDIWLYIPFALLGVKLFAKPAVESASPAEVATTEHSKD